MSRFKAHWSASSQGEVEQSPPGCLLVKGPKERDDGHAASTQQAAQTESPVDSIQMDPVTSLKL